MSDQKKRIEEAAAWAQTPEGQAKFEEARKKAKTTTDYLSKAREVSPEQFYSPLGLEKRGECKNCEQLLARIKELEESDKQHSKTLEQAHAMLQAFQGIENIVNRIKERIKTDHSPDATKKVEPDPWLGVWRAKRHTALDNITTKVAFLEPGTIIRVKGIKDGYVHIFFGQEDFEWHTISWPQENFEKVTEEGEG